MMRVKTTQQNLPSTLWFNCKKFWSCLFSNAGIFLMAAGLTNLSQSGPNLTLAIGCPRNLYFRRKTPINYLHRSVAPGAAFTIPGGNHVRPHQRRRMRFLHQNFLPFAFLFLRLWLQRTAASKLFCFGHLDRRTLFRW